MTKLLKFKYAGEFEEHTDLRIIKKHSIKDLYLRSGLILLFLYGILFFIFGIGFFIIGGSNIREFELISAGLIVFIATSIGLLIEFLLAPFLLDVILYIFYGARSVDIEVLPSRAQEFIKNFCAKHKISLPSKNGLLSPKLKIIYDMNPNAFTYGFNKGFYRLVLTEGLLKLLTDDELIAVLGHELGHVKHYDMAIMTLAIIVPSVLVSCNILAE